METKPAESQDSGQEDNPVYWPHTPAVGQRYIYMYYLELHAAHHRQLQVFFIDQKRPMRLTARRAEELIDQADAGMISPVGWNIQDLRWRYKSYLLFIMRNNNKRFATRNAAIFTRRVDQTAGQLPEIHYTFRDGVDISGTNDPDISGMWCINQRLNWNGNPLGIEENEVFDIFFPGISHPPAHNEAGSNTGP